MTTILQKALTEATRVRRELGISDFEPVNIFEICQKLGVEVRFDDINMEGIYAINGNHAYIILSKLRPMPRRVYTCAHELGHHRFGHGDRIDGLIEEGKESDVEEERLVDMFAGFLLMPIAAIGSQFRKRGWEISEVGAIEFQTVASAFGTGYQTLITHCNANNLITASQKAKLLKTKPKQILQCLAPSQTATVFFKIVDRFSRLAATDIEVSNFIFLPKDCEIEGTHLVKVEQTTAGIAYEAIHPGIVRVISTDKTFSLFIRIQKAGYEGWAEYRHLEN